MLHGFASYSRCGGPPPARHWSGARLGVIPVALTLWGASPTHVLKRHSTGIAGNAQRVPFSSSFRLGSMTHAYVSVQAPVVGPKGLHADRTAGGDRDHRRSG